MKDTHTYIVVHLTTLMGSIGSSKEVIYDRG
jgi:hypothetical protein